MSDEVEGGLRIIVKKKLRIHLTSGKMKNILF